MTCHFWCHTTPISRFFRASRSVHDRIQNKSACFWISVNKYALHRVASEIWRWVVRLGPEVRVDIFKSSNFLVFKPRHIKRDKTIIPWKSTPFQTPVLLWAREATLLQIWQGRRCAFYLSSDANEGKSSWMNHCLQSLWNQSLFGTLWSTNGRISYKSISLLVPLDRYTFYHTPLKIWKWVIHLSF
jgi:hypothetical protein